MRQNVFKNKFYILFLKFSVRSNKNFENNLIETSLVLYMYITFKIYLII